MAAKPKKYDPYSASFPRGKFCRPLFGAAMAHPLIGQQRRGGHAWVLVGYDHVDGNNQWKYQGRFVALNSWGKGWPAKPMRQAGLCHIPFSMLLTEGIHDKNAPGAYAIRFG